MPSARSDWTRELERWLAPFLERLGHKMRRRWAPVYVQGLLSPAARKSVEPMAAQVAPDDVQQLHHFIAAAPWATAPLEAELVRQADRLVGGVDAVLVIDDTALPKKGKHSVGVAPQYAGALGKRANCQTLVSLTLAKGDVPVPVVLRLFLPAEWTDDPARCAKAGVPEAHRAPRAKTELALDEIDRVRAAGARFGCVLADAGYGISAAFRQALSARGLSWAVGIPRIQKVFAADVALTWPTAGRGRPRRTAIPRSASITAEDMLAGASWRRITWRRGTKGPLAAAFAAVRVRVADGPAVRMHTRNNQHLPGEEVWLVGERRASGEKKYYLSNLSADTGLRRLAATIKARWVCEQAHQQLKEELGLDHFEGRSWQGLHHHALMTLIAYAFLQHLRLGEKKPATAAPRPAAAPEPAGGPPVHRRRARAPLAPMSALPKPRPDPPASLKLAE